MNSWKVIRKWVTTKDFGGYSPFVLEKYWLQFDQIGNSSIKQMIEQKGPHTHYFSDENSKFENPFQKTRIPCSAGLEYQQKSYHYQNK